MHAHNGLEGLFNILVIDALRSLAVLKAANITNNNTKFEILHGNLQSQINFASC